MVDNSTTKNSKKIVFSEKVDYMQNETKKTILFLRTYQPLRNQKWELFFRFFIPFHFSNKEIRIVNNPNSYLYINLLAFPLIVDKR